MGTTHPECAGGSAACGRTVEIDLAALVADMPQDDQRGVFTTGEYAAARFPHLSEAVARHKALDELSAMVGSGRVEEATKRVRTRGGRMTTVNAWRVRG